MTPIFTSGAAPCAVAWGEVANTAAEAPERSNARRSSILPSCPHDGLSAADILSSQRKPQICARRFLWTALVSSLAAGENDCPRNEMMLTERTSAGLAIG